MLKKEECAEKILTPTEKSIYQISGGFIAKGKEVGFIIDKKGEVLHQQLGTKRQVKMKKIEWEEIKKGKDNLIDVHTHPIDVPHSPKDLYTCLTTRELKKCTIFAPKRNVYVVEKTDHTSPPILIGGKSGFGRQYNDKVREIMRREGVMDSRELDQKELQTEVVEYMADLHGFNFKKCD